MHTVDSPLFDKHNLPSFISKKNMWNLAAFSTSHSPSLSNAIAVGQGCNENHRLTAHADHVFSQTHNTHMQRSASLWFHSRIPSVECVFVLRFHLHRDKQQIQANYTLAEASHYDRCCRCCCCLIYYVTLDMCNWKLKSSVCVHQPEIPGTELNLCMNDLWLNAVNSYRICTLWIIMCSMLHKLMIAVEFDEVSSDIGLIELAAAAASCIEPRVIIT